MTAYCKMIEESDHFVYIENQFYISSCETMNVKIVNKIGDAIVERAIRAYNNNESWRCILLIPLMPGFQNTVDEPEGTSVRLIMQCQFRSICRGEGSIFGRLRAQGIEPEDFVNFYSLRSWGKIGPNKTLVTEQLYIHAKAIIVDDRIALIGSANINERSMLGVRDSETAAVVRDTDMIWSTMDGKPYLVGRFAHTLRMRLMREHLGLDIDEFADEERTEELDRELDEYETKMNSVYDGTGDSDTDRPNEYANTGAGDQAARQAIHERLRSFNHDVDWEEEGNPNIQPDKLKPITSDKRVTGNAAHAAEVDGDGPDQMKAAQKSGVIHGRDSVLAAGGREVLVTDIAAEGKGTLNRPKKPHARRHHHHHNIGDDYDDENPVGNENLPPLPRLPRRTTEQLGLPQLSQLPALPLVDDTDIGGPPVIYDNAGNPAPKPFNPLTADIKPVNLDKDCMRDPLNDTFFDDTWRRIADNNTSIFRKVFRCNPDSLVTNWHEYTEYVAYAERFAQAQNGGKSTEREQQEAVGKSGPPGALNTGLNLHGLGNLSEKVMPNHHNPDGLGTVAEWAQNAANENQSRHGLAGPALDANNEKSVPPAAAYEEAPSPIQPSGSETFPSLDTTVESSPDSVLNHTASTSTRKTTFPANLPPDKVNTGFSTQGSQKKRRRGTTKSKKGFSASDDLLSREDAEELLDLVQGHLVVFPYDWLVREELNSNWLYQVDQVAPLQI